MAEPVPEPDPDETLEDESDADDDDSDKDQELETITEGAVESSYAEQASEIARANEHLANVADLIEVSADSEVEVDLRDSRYDDAGSQSDGEKDPDDHSSQEIRKLRRQARDYREDNLGTQAQGARLFARVKGISLLLAIASTVTGAVSLIVAIIVLVNTPKDKTPPGMDPKLAELLRKRIDAWTALGDATMWAAIATYCDQYNPTWQAQMLIADTIKLLPSLVPAGWAWRGNDEATYVNKLRDTYGAFQPAVGQSRARILYTTVATMTYDGLTPGTQQPLPRKMAADVLELALVDIALETGQAA